MVPKTMFDLVLEQLSMLREQIARMQETIDKLVEDNQKKDAIIEEKNQIIRCTKPVSHRRNEQKQEGTILMQSGFPDTGNGLIKTM